MARKVLAVLGVIVGLAGVPAASAVVPPLQQPAWSELTPEQKHVLAPLAADWDSLEPYRKKKWLGIATRYPTMGTEEQARIQANMKDWARLSAEERKAAREKFKTLKKAPPETQQAVKDKWQEYRELPVEEKEKLREAAKARPTPKSAAGRPSGMTGSMGGQLTVPVSRPIQPISSTPAVTPAPSAATDR